MMSSRGKETPEEAEGLLNSISKASPGDDTEENSITTDMSTSKDQDDEYLANLDEKGRKKKDTEVRVSVFSQFSAKGLYACATTVD